MTVAPFRTLRPGRLPYRSGLALQETLVEARCQGGDDILLLLEHEAVITLGRGARRQHLLRSPAELAAAGIDLVETGRGGEVTWHGPGQLVGYPIVDLSRCDRDLHRYLRLLEEMLIRTLAAFAVTGERLPGKTGVWVGGEKIASIGVGVRRWIGWHGFALNVGADLSGFETIVPCGLHGVRMTSLEMQLGRPLPLRTVEKQLIAAFAATFHAPYAGAYVPPAAS